MVTDERCDHNWHFRRGKTTVARYPKSSPLTRRRGDKRCSHPHHIGAGRHAGNGVDELRLYLPEAGLGHAVIGLWSSDVLTPVILRHPAGHPALALVQGCVAADHPPTRLKGPGREVQQGSALGIVKVVQQAEKKDHVELA